MKQPTQKSKIIRIGNSQGVRLAKHMLDTSNISGEVEILAQPGKITIVPVTKEHPRSRWAEQIATLAEKEKGGDFLEWETTLADGIEELYEA